MILLWPVVGIGIVMHLSLALWYIRHRDSESELHFERPVAYVAYAVFLLGLYLVLIGGVGKAVEWLGGDLRAFLSALGGVLMAVLGLALASSPRVWARIRDYVDRNFYRGEVDFRREWIRISEELSALPDPRDLGSTLSGLLSDRLRAETVFLYRREEDGHFDLWSRRGGEDNPPEHLTGASQWIDWLWRLGAPADWSAMKATDIPESLSTQSRLVVPLIAKREIVALACIGGRSEDFTAEELLWLEAAGQQAAIGVLAANLTERLIETRELASFHRLSSFVVHDVKNAISMISLLLQNLEQGKGEISADAARTTLRQAANKLTGLIDRFSGARETFKLMRQPLVLNNLIDEICVRLSPGFPRVTVNTDISEELTVHGDSEQLSKVFENLFINACEAMRGDGILNIVGMSDHSGVAVSFSDNGPGMDDDFVRERLFRPFATTKKKGLGIGLYQSREIVRAHNGRMSAASEVGQGASFRVWLPVEAHTA
jgi:putative PEP-CTERM system histidine kinase